MKNVSLFALAGSAWLMTACNNEASQVKAEDLTPAVNQTARGIDFNLAAYAREKSQMKILSGMFVDGDPYLAIGPKSLFQIQTNLVATSNVVDEVNNVESEFWMDGFIFGTPAVKGEGRGLLLDLVGHVTSKPLTGIVKFRLVGQEKFVGDLTSKYEARFTRDFSGEGSYYPVPLLGLRASGMIGGDFGLKAQLEQREGYSVGLSFIPSVAVSGGIGGKIELLNFTSATAESHMELLNTTLATFTNLEYVPKLKLLLTSTEVEGGSWEALKGKIIIKAHVTGLDSGVPKEVDPKLWEKADADGTFRHTVWESKKSIVMRDIPQYLQIEPTFSKDNLVNEDCENTADAYAFLIGAKLKAAGERLAKLEEEKKSAPSKQLDLQILEAKASKSRYEATVTSIRGFCTRPPQIEESEDDWNWSDIPLTD